LLAQPCPPNHFPVLCPHCQFVAYTDSKDDARKQLQLHSGVCTQANAAMREFALKQYGTSITACIRKHRKCMALMKRQNDNMRRFIRRCQKTVENKL
jgi:hypothetical protein